ncbi:MAG TPA: EamA family transporter, partial [Candidatus Eremiobacteraceae bacterium]|nr:EamA family transporter [Candidatus Eremiobacteraceae bacterium]
TMPPLVMAGGRFLIAGLLLCAWRFPIAARSGSLPTPQQWLRTAIVGALLLVGGNGAVSWAEQTVPSGLTALLVSVVPLWMALIDRFMNGVRLHAVAIAGLMIGVVGCVVLVGAPGSSNVPLIGAAVVALGSFLWAAGSIYSRTARLPSDSFLALGMEMLCGGVMLFAGAALSGEFGRFHLAAVTSASWIAFVYLIFIGGIAGFWAYLWLIRNAPTSLVATYAYVNPVVAVILGALILHEHLSLQTLLGGSIIVAAVALIVTSTAAKRVGTTVARGTASR